MATGIDNAALTAAFNDYFDTFESWIIDRLANADLPLFGAGLTSHAATLTAFLDDYRGRVSTAIAALDAATDEPLDVATAFVAAGFGTSLSGDVLDLTLNFEALSQALPDVPLLADLGLAAPGFGFGGNANLSADITSEFLFQLDVATGALTRPANATDAFNMTLTGDIALDAAGSLGFIDVALAETALPSQPSNIVLDVNMTAWAGGGAKLTAEGSVGFAAQLDTTTDAAILPTLGAEFGATFDIAAQTLQAGVGIDAQARLWLDNVTLDLGGFSAFLGAVFGELDRLLGTFPLGALIDIVTQELPVLPDIVPGMEDNNDSDDVITILDLLNSIGANINTDFLDEVIYLVRVIQAVADLTDQGVLTLGGVDLSVGATAALTGSGTLDGSALLDPGSIRAGDPEPQAWLDFLDVLAQGDGLNLPFLADPLNNLVGLLLNGLGAPVVDLVSYDLPQFQFVQGIDIPFWFGPIKFFVGGEFGATIDMEIGYDTAGLDPAGLDFSQGFYLGTFGPDGQPTPFSTLSMTLEAGGGLDALLASVTVAGGITGTLGMNLVGSADGKTYLAELASFPCIFKDITGTVSAGLNIEFTLGKKPFAITDRLTIAEVILAQFNIDPCDLDGQDMRMTATGLAREKLGGELLELHVGTQAWRRALPEAADNNGGAINFDSYDPLAGRDGHEAQDEIIVVSRAPVDTGEGLRPETEALAVQAFGIYEVFESGSSFDRVLSESGLGNDYIALGEGLTLMADFSGGDGNDTLIGAGGDDSLQGNQKRDQLYGNDGNDTLLGGWGNDVLVGGNGADLLDGGSGAVDEVDYSNAISGVILTPQVSGGAFVEFVASSNGILNEAEGDTLRGIEYVRGSEFDDILTANPFEANILQGQGGNDLLIGSAADDLLSGGAGADTLAGGTGEDTASYVLSDAAVWIDLASGLVFGGEAQGDVLTDIESLDLTYHDDYAHGTTGANYIDGFGGDDVIIGGGGADTLRGGGGADTVYASGEEDVLNGGGTILQGQNVGLNTDNRDLLTYQDAAWTGGIDANLLTGEVSLRGGAAGARDVIAHAAMLDGDLNEVAQTDFSSFEDLTGSAYADVLTGDAGENVLRGRNGADLINAQAGSDTLIGGFGADTLNGGQGIDWVDYSGSGEGITIDLGGGTGVGGTAEGDVIGTVENAIGTAFADSLSGSFVGNILDPGLVGGTGDTVAGGLGIDTLRLQWAEEDRDVTMTRRFDGDSETHLGIPDTFIEVDATSMEQVHVTTGSGDDLITSDLDGIDVGTYADYASTGDGNDTINLGSGRDIVYAGAGADTVIRMQASGPEVFILDGGDGDDRLSIDLTHATEDLNMQGKLLGTGPMQTLYFEGGGVARNFEYLGDVTGGAGDDTIGQLGRADNVFSGGAGNDLFLLESGDNQIDGGGGTYTQGGAIHHYLDRLEVDASRLDGRLESAFFPAGKNGFDGAIAFYENLLGLEVLTGTTDYTGIERLSLIGGSRDDVLVGLSVAATVTTQGDRLEGGDGDDYLSGLAGQDTLIGGAGADELLGGSHADTLIAGDIGTLDGVDTVTGGGGADLFVLGTEDGSLYGYDSGDYALITDFSTANDTLQLFGSASDYTLLFTVSGDTLINAAATGHRVATITGAVVRLSDPFVTYVSAPAAAAAPLAGTASATLGGVSITPGPITPDDLETATLALDPFQAMTWPMFEILFGAGTTPTNETLFVDGAGSAAMLDGEPFGMGYVNQNRGFGLSTGDIADVAGQNLEDGANTPEPMDGLPSDLSFERIGVTAGGSVVFRALLPASAGAINTLTVRDSNNLQGAGGVYSGFDLDGIMLSRDRLDPVAQGTDLDLSGLSTLDVFDFSPAGTFLEAGRQSNRVNPLFVPSAANTAGTINGMVDEGFARLGSVDFDGNPLNGGAFSLGDGGAVTFGLTQAVDSTTPLYLYLAEAADNGERPDASVSATAGTVQGAGDLSEDRGTPGGADDTMRVGYRFDIDLDDALGGAAWTDLFQLVVVTEELPENRQSATPDSFDIRINGMAAGVLSDGRTATMDNLMLDRMGGLSDDVVMNLAGTGPLDDYIRADAYTQILTVSGVVLDGSNSFEFSVADGGDGLLDTAIFLVPVTGELIEGTSAAESLRGTDLTDRLKGAQGDDTLNALAGKDSLYGQAGNDLLLGGAGAELLDGGAGDDTASYEVDSTEGVTASLLDPSANTGNALGDVYVGIENLTGTDNTDDLQGDTASNVLTGRGGADLILGMNGADTIYGDDGDDTIDGGAVGDLIDSGTGNDSVIGGNGRDSVFLGDGADIFVDNDQESFGEDTVDGGAGADTLLGAGGDDSLIAGAGYDSVEGGIGNDWISGGDGYDVLDGGDGNDTVDGGDGRDTISLGAGDDLLTESAQTGWSAADDVHGNGGADTLYGGGGNDTMHGDWGADSILGGGEDDLIYGDDQNDTLLGQGGNDTVYGGDGADEAALGAGHDVWQDNAQDSGDTVDGGAGNDTLNTGGGTDFLTGGAGADVFVLTTGMGFDVITDFELGTDTLMIEAALWGGPLTQTYLDSLDNAESLVSLNFGGGDEIRLDGTNGTAGLLADIVLF